uniref:Glycoside hydrolase family 5 domain-containing protein n=2 Tax=Rhizochromulina marina TaxID=1034831 RepID=A0A7S2WMK6_9STRA
MTCTADAHTNPFNTQVRGVSIGGWLVLEPWITPSLFYQFLGADEEHTAMDMYSFCQVLGPEEGNKQLRRHWDTWVTEAIIDELAAAGINSLRLPVGDWMYEPYGPYVGCTDGALDKVDWLLDQAAKHKLSVLLDLHGVIGSQNGFDNSGQSSSLVWTSILSTKPIQAVTFVHWPIRSAGWIGTFDSTGFYSSINREHIAMTLRVITAIVDRYHTHPSVLGLEPVNEPWELTPLDILKNFYWEGYLIVKRRAPAWKYIMHDSFRFTPESWGGFMAGCPDIAMDTHIYQAWNNPANKEAFFTNACEQKARIIEMERVFGPVVVGEFSLATDNCAMWLNGFNDNLPGYPKLPCKFVQCPKPYMGSDQPGAPPDPTKPIQQPYGTGTSGPSFGLCPVDIDWVDGDEDVTDDVMTALAAKKFHAFETGHGYYFWNFRSELEPQWSFLKARKRGWIPESLQDVETISSACEKEDKGLYYCLARRGIFEITLKNGMLYATHGENATWIQGLHGDTLVQAADRIFNNYWQTNRDLGGTCDFGGAAELHPMHNVSQGGGNESTTQPKSPAASVSVVSESAPESPRTPLSVTTILFCILLAALVAAGARRFLQRNKGLGHSTPSLELSSAWPQPRMRASGYSPVATTSVELPQTARRSGAPNKLMPASYQTQV